MENIQKIILKILQGYIKDSQGGNVPVVLRQFPLDKTPCITINSEGGVPVDNAFVMQEENTVPPGHPDYDENNPDKKVIQDVYYQKKHDTIIINCWYNRKEDADLISDQVEECLFLARTNNYRYCTNYDRQTGECSTIHEKCHVLTSKNGLAVKGLCPEPDQYKYSSLLYQHYVLPTTFKIEAIYNQDEYNQNTVLYRRIIKLDVKYYKSHLIGGKRFGQPSMEVNDNG